MYRKESRVLSRTFRSSKSKIGDCEELTIKAFKSQDEEKLKEVENDLECKFAKKAIYKFKLEKREEELRLQKIKKGKTI